MKFLRFFAFGLGLAALVLPALATKKLQLQGHEGMGSECVLIDSSWVLTPKALAFGKLAYGVEIGSKVYDVQDFVPMMTNETLVLLRLRELVLDVRPVQRLRYKKIVDVR